MARVNQIQDPDAIPPQQTGPVAGNPYGDGGGTIIPEPTNPGQQDHYSGTTVGWTGEAQFGPNPNRPARIREGGHRRIPLPDEGPGIPLIPDIGIGGVPFRDVNLDNFNPVTREVQQEELTSYQLGRLLAGDSAYMQNARRRGMEQAGERGAFGSSLMSESAMRAAIDAGEPIARADAAAYIQAASENLQVVNANINNKLSAATSIANTHNTNAANMAIADLRARTETAIAQAEIESRYGLQSNEFGHSIFMEELVQTGRLELANLNADLQRELQSRGFGHDIVMSELSQQQRIELEELFNQPRWQADYQLRRAGMEAGIITQVMGMYAQFVDSLNNQDIDDAARERGMSFINSWAEATLAAIGIQGFQFGFGGGDG